MCPAPPRKEVVRATGVPRHENRGERLACLRVPADIGAAPRQQLEKEPIVALRRQAYGFPALHCSGLTRQLRGILSFFDHDTTPKARANVVTPALLEGGEQLVGRAHGDDARVLRLRRLDLCESTLAENLRKSVKSLRLEPQLGDPRGARPFHQRIDRGCGCRHRAARHIRLANGSDATKLNARECAATKANTFHRPTCARLHLSPAPCLEKR